MHLWIDSVFFVESCNFDNLHVVGSGYSENSFNEVNIGYGLMVTWIMSKYFKRVRSFRKKKPACNLRWLLLYDGLIIGVF